MQTVLLLNALVSPQKTRGICKNQQCYPSCCVWVILSLQTGQSVLYLFHQAGMTAQISVGYLRWQKNHFSRIAVWFHLYSVSHQLFGPESASYRVMYTVTSTSIDVSTSPVSAAAEMWPITNCFIRKKFLSTT